MHLTICINQLTEYLLSLVKLKVFFLSPSVMMLFLHDAFCSAVTFLWLIKDLCWKLGHLCVKEGVHS